MTTALLTRGASSTEVSDDQQHGNTAVADTGAVNTLLPRHTSVNSAAGLCVCVCAVFGFAAVTTL